MAYIAGSNLCLHLLNQLRSAGAKELRLAALALQALLGRLELQKWPLHLQSLCLLVQVFGQVKGIPGHVHSLSWPVAQWHKQSGSFSSPSGLRSDSLEHQAEPHAASTSTNSYVPKHASLILISFEHLEQTLKSLQPQNLIPTRISCGKKLFPTTAALNAFYRNSGALVLKSRLASLCLDLLGTLTNGKVIFHVRPVHKVSH